VLVQVAQHPLLVLAAQTQAQGQVVGGARGEEGWAGEGWGEEGWGEGFQEQWRA